MEKHALFDKEVLVWKKSSTKKRKFYFGKRILFQMRKFWYGKVPLEVLLWKEFPLKIFWWKNNTYKH